MKIDNSESLLQWNLTITWLRAEEDWKHSVCWLPSSPSTMESTIVFSQSPLSPINDQWFILHAPLHGGYYHVTWKFPLHCDNNISWFLVLLAFWEDGDLGINKQAADKTSITGIFFCFVCVCFFGGVGVGLGAGWLWTVLPIINHTAYCKFFWRTCITERLGSKRLMYTYFPREILLILLTTRRLCW